MTFPSQHNSLIFREIDYTTLDSLLAEENWREADEETWNLMLRIATVGMFERILKKIFNQDKLLYFPRQELHIINQLWLDYSNGQFGFSLQKSVFSELNFSFESNNFKGQVWEEIGDHFGWRKNGQWKEYNQLTFSLEANKGHLPLLGSCYIAGWGLRATNYSSLVSSHAWKSLGDESFDTFSTMFDTTPTTQEQVVQCSEENQVERIITEDGVNIYNECVDLYNQILEEEKKPENKENLDIQNIISASSANWVVGQQIQNLYQVQEFLGLGGFGEVYKMQHLEWNIDLAVKKPKSERIAAAGGIKNFEKEAQTWVELGLYPHIVSCYYVSRIDNVPCVFAEYVSGGSLYDWIYGNDNQPPQLYQGSEQEILESILDIAIQFAWGLDYAHRKEFGDDKGGMIHQDIKPANIMMTSNRTVKVTDFGLSKSKRKAEEIFTIQNLIVTGGGGTPAYFSPEQAQLYFSQEELASKKLKLQSDMFSFGLCLLEMFKGEKRWQYGNWVTGDDLDYYLGLESNYPVEMPEEVNSLLRKCLQENPEDRYQDMLVIANELQGIYEQKLSRIYLREKPKEADLIAPSLNNQALSLLLLAREEEDKELKQEREKGALVLWNQALKAQPNHPETTYNQGLFLWRIGEKKNDECFNDNKFVASLENVISVNPEAWLPKYLLAMVHMERDDYESAIPLLKEIEDKGIELEKIENLWSKTPVVIFALLLLIKSELYRLASLFILSEQNLLTYAKERLYKSTRLLEIFEGHEDSVQSVCITKDSQQFFSGDGISLKKWDRQTGNSKGMGLNTLEQYDLIIFCLALSKDENYLLSGSWNKIIKFWNTRTRECLWKSPKQKGLIRDVALNMEKGLAVSAGMRDLKLWEIKKDPQTGKWTGKCVQNFSEDFFDKYLSYFKQVRSVDLSKTGTWIVSGHASLGAIRVWDTVTGDCLQVFKAHSSDIYSLSISDNERFVLSAGQDKTIKMWNVTLINNKPSLSHFKTFEGHTDYIFSACLSSNNELIVSGSKDGTVKIWEVKTGRCLRTLIKQDGAINSVCLSADRFALSGGDDKNLKLWRIDCLNNNYKASLKLSRSNYIENDLEFSEVFGQEYSQAETAFEAKNYRLALSHIHEALNQPNFSENKEALILLGNLYKFLPRQSFQNYILFNSWNYDSSNLIDENSFWTLSRWEEWNATPTHNPEMGYNLRTSTHLSLDGDTFLFSRICSNQRLLKVLNLPYFDSQPISIGVESYLQRLVHDEDYQRLINREEEQAEQSQNIFQNLVKSIRDTWFCLKFQAKNLKSNLDNLAYISSANFANLGRDKSFILFAKNFELTKYNIQEKKSDKITLLSGFLYVILKYFNSICLLSSGTVASLYLFIWGNFATTSLWNKFLWILVLIVSIPVLIVSIPKLIPLSMLLIFLFFYALPLQTYLVTTLALSEDQQFALVGHKGGLIRFWDIQQSDNRLLTDNGHTDTVNSLGLSRDNLLGVSGSDDGTVKLWNVSRKECINTFSEHTGKVLSVCMSSDNRFILSSSSESEKNLILRDLDRGKQVVAFTILLLIKNGFYELPLLMVNSDRTFIQNTSKYTFLNGHDGAVNSVCLSVDSRVALSGGSDKTVKLWDVETGECLSIFEGHTGEVTSVALSGDCRWAVSAAGDEVKLWFFKWELEERELIDWDEGARPYLDSFLQRHRLPAPNSSEKNSSIYVWKEQDFQYLIEDLGFVGYGWLRPEGVRRQLENMVGLNFEDHQFLNDTEDIDYTPLRCLLAGKRWKAANEETWKLILKVSKREKEGYIRDVQIWENTYSQHIYLIDRLWVEYSQGKFGFSVQKSIFSEILGFSELIDQSSNNFQFEDWEKIGDRLGWRKENQWLSYNDLTFDDVEANRGHLPLLGQHLIISPWSQYCLNYYYFMSSTIGQNLGNTNLH